MMCPEILVFGLGFFLCGSISVAQYRGADDTIVRLGPPTPVPKNDVFQLRPYRGAFESFVLQLRLARPGPLYKPSTTLSSQGWRFATQITIVGIFLFTSTSSHPLLLQALGIQKVCPAEMGAQRQQRAFLMKRCWWMHEEEEFNIPKDLDVLLNFCKGVFIEVCAT